MSSIFHRISVRKYKDKPVEEDNMRAVEKILDIPDNLRAFAIFPFGYPDEHREQQNRFDESRIHYVK